MNSIMNENEYIKNGTMIIFFSLIICEHVYPVLCRTGEKHLLRYGNPRIMEYRSTLWVRRALLRLQLGAGRADIGRVRELREELRGAIGFS